MALPFWLYLITDRRLAADGDLPALLGRALQHAQPGEVAVQLREKDLADDALLALARAVREVTLAHNTPLLVNDHIDVALAAGADGVHLPGQGCAPAEARRRLGPDRLLGVSTHSLEEARAARADGADFVTFGPVFATPSKARYGPPVGLPALAAATAALTPFPVVALGGVDVKNAQSCRKSGAAAVSVIRAVLAADDPAIARRALTAAARQATEE